MKKYTSPTIEFFFLFVSWNHNLGLTCIFTYYHWPRSNLGCWIRTQSFMPLDYALLLSVIENILIIMITYGTFIFPWCLDVWSHHSADETDAPTQAHEWAVWGEGQDSVVWVLWSNFMVSRLCWYCYSYCHLFSFFLLLLILLLSLLSMLLLLIAIISNIAFVGLSSFREDKYLLFDFPFGSASLISKICGTLLANLTSVLYLPHDGSCVDKNPPEANDIRSHEGDAHPGMRRQITCL